MQTKIKVKLQGSKTSSYVLVVSNPEDKFLWDVALTHEELLVIKELLNKKII